MGKDPAVADQMAKDPELRQKMSDNVKNDPDFFKKVM